MGLGQAAVHATLPGHAPRQSAGEPVFAGDLTPLELRRALGRFATGVTVVTALGPEGKPLGLTANSFTSVSMDPPLVLWCLASHSHNLQAFMEAPSFAINVLASHQQDVCRQFADPQIADRFAQVDWWPGPQGNPLLAEALVRMECERWQAHEAGDHVIFIGRITALDTQAGDPLVFSAGKLGGFQAPA